MPEWDIPKWRKQGRTGPGPSAPRYKSRSDRAAVRRGGSPGQPPKKGCAVVAFLIIGAPVWSVIEIVKAVM